jgi:anti-sigma B factor antagonist
MPEIKLPLTVQTVKKWTVVEFRTASLMDPLELQAVGDALYHLVDAQDKRLQILDFTQVEFLSSQAIGILIQLNRKLGALPNSKLILCGVGARLQELLRITRLDKVFIVKPSQREAVEAFPVL